MQEFKSDEIIIGTRIWNKQLVDVLLNFTTPNNLSGTIQTLDKGEKVPVNTQLCRAR
jgi:hypothetical protein